MYHVVDALSGPARQHRVRRVFGYIFGVVFLIASYAALVPALLLVAVIFVTWASGTDVSFDNVDATIIAVFAGSIVASIVLLRIGVRMIRGRRHLVLFLRKFGFTKATEALSVAISEGVGRRWRLITLDDHDVAPMGVGGRSRWTVRLLRLLLVALTVAAGVAAARALSPEAYDRMVEEAKANAESDAASQFGASLGAIIGAAFLMMFWSFIIALVAVGGVLLTTATRSARQAEQAKAVVVKRPEEIESVAHSLRKQTKKVLAPRIIVARVSDAIWQPFVRRMATTSDVVLVDISSPTKNLVWEVRTLVTDHARWLPVGDVDRLAQLASDPSDTAVELRGLLGDGAVIGYRTATLQTFSDGLRHSLEVVAA
jgi:hypothetical protein